MYLAHLRAAAPSAAEPATRAAVDTYESANGHTTVTSHVNGFPSSQGTRESPSGRFPSDRLRPFGSLVTVEYQQRPWHGLPNHSKRGALPVFREPSCRQNYVVCGHRPGIHSGNCVAQKRQTKPHYYYLSVCLTRQHCVSAAYCIPMLTHVG